MELQSLLIFFLIIPFTGFVFSFFISRQKESDLTNIGFYTAGASLFLSLFTLFVWINGGMEDTHKEIITLYHHHDYRFFLDLHFDEITMIYALTGSFITFLITRYSRYYMHREEGFKRFFTTILFFFFGYNVIIFSGNFETLFIGWEIIGISSFLLISFHRERYLPVRNAVKVFSIYRIGDIGILLAMWASHHLWHKNIMFSMLENSTAVAEQVANHTQLATFISLMILLAASAKSAQFPFSSWLPRAMEGPTPSSAIFYGSLSVHFGVFLLLRTLNFWSELYWMKIVIGLLGLTTSLVASSIGRVQSSVKTQIAYASIAQIGIIFIELSLGLKALALIHFTGNAFLRTYQLLVSPSVITYLIREQFYNFIPRLTDVSGSSSGKWQNALYLLGIKEWGMDTVMRDYVFTPLKKAGQQLNFISRRTTFWIIIPVAIAGWLLYFSDALVPGENPLPFVFGLFSFLLGLKAFSERKDPLLAWMLLLLNHVFNALAVSFNENFAAQHTLIYLSGIIIAGLGGYIVLSKLNKLEPVNFNLSQYYGHVYEYPTLAGFFFVMCLGVMGFPVTLSFLGGDLLMSHIHTNQAVQIIFNALCYLMTGIAVVRMYSRLFLGPHIKTYHEVAYKSA